MPDLTSRLFGAGRIWCGTEVAQIFSSARGRWQEKTDCGKNIATQKRAFDTDSQSSIFVSTNYGFFLAVPFSKLIKVRSQISNISNWLYYVVLEAKKGGSDRRVRIYRLSSSRTAARSRRQCESCRFRAWRRREEQPGGCRARY